MGRGVVEFGCWVGRVGCYQCTGSTDCMGMVVAGKGLLAGTMAWETDLEIGLAGKSVENRPQGMDCPCTSDTCPRHCVHGFHLPSLGMGHHTVGVPERLGAFASVVVASVHEHAPDLSVASVVALLLSHQLAAEMYRLLDDGRGRSATRIRGGIAGLTRPSPCPQRHPP